MFNQRSSSETIAIADIIDASQHFNIAVVSEAIHSLHDAASWWKQEKNSRPPKAEVIEICRKAVQDLPLIERLEYVDRIDELTDEQQLAIEPPADYDDAYVEDVADGVIQSGIDLIDWAENGDGAEFLSMHGIDDIEELRRHGEKHFNTLLIGLYLRWLFQKISAFSPGLITDYSPSSIMLCKTIERMLKEKHLPLYKDRSVWVNRVMTNDPPHSPVQFPRKATIGTFTTAMATMFEIDSADREATKKQQNRDAFLAHTSASEAAWFEYYTKMKNVLAVRNRTAHTNQVTDSECDDVIKTLFEEELLNQTVDYL